MLTSMLTSIYVNFYLLPTSLISDILKYPSLLVNCLLKARDYFPIIKSLKITGSGSAW